MFLMLRLIGIHTAGVTVLLIMYLRCLKAWRTPRRTDLLLLK